MKKYKEIEETVLLSIPICKLQVLIIDAVNACLDVREAEKEAKEKEANNG